MKHNRFMALLLALTCLLCQACAGVKYQKAPKGLPSVSSAEAQDHGMAFYQAHCIEAVHGADVTLEGQAGPATGGSVGFRMLDGRGMVYKPSPPLGRLDAAAWALVPAGALVGTVVGVVVYVASYMVTLDNNPRVDGFLAAGAGVGGGLGLVGASALTLSMPGMVQRSQQKAAARYNQTLWRNLGLGPVPIRGGEALRLHLEF
jgi:hypothetical protein